MNRRAFILGTIASPIAAKIAPVSAALRTIVAKVYGRSPVMLVMGDLKARNKYHQDMIDLLTQSNELMNHIAWRDPPGLTAAARRAMLRLLAAIRLAESAALLTG